MIFSGCVWAPAGCGRRGGVYAFARTPRWDDARRVFQRGRDRRGAYGVCTARCEDPVEQAMMGIFEVFVDTILICTLTALMVLVSGVPIPYGDADASGMAIALDALATVVPKREAGVFLAVCVALFAFSSMLGWSLYGVRAAEFLLGAKGIRHIVPCFWFAPLWVQ